MGGYINKMDILGQIGIVLFGALIIGFIYLINMLSRDIKDQKKDVAELRKELIETIGPNFDKMTEILKNQDHINNELIRQMNTQTHVLSELKELKSNYHELTSNPRPNLKIDGSSFNSDDQ